VETERRGECRVGLNTTHRRGWLLNILLP